MFNQPEINSLDQYAWRGERIIINGRIQEFCRKNQINFIFTLSEDSIKNSVSDKIVWMQLFDLIPEYKYWQHLDLICKQSGKVLFVVTDNILKFNNLDHIKFFSYPELLGVTATYNKLPTISHPPSKLYNCFMQRADPIRQSWFYFLYQNNLLNNGYVSFLLKHLDNPLTGEALFEHIHYQYSLNQLPHFEHAYQDLKDQIPYRNFDENYNLLPLIQDSKYSLVLETSAVNDDLDQWHFTEKSLRALQFPNILLLFSQKGSIAILKSLGFKFALDLDFIDNLPWQDRQQQLLNLLINDQVDVNKDILYNISLCNRELLQSWKSKYQKIDFFDEFYTEANTF